MRDTVSTKDEVRQIYTETLGRVNSLIADLKSSNERNDEAVKKDVETLIADIEHGNGRLAQFVGELEKDCEFEKFSIAFFGQTNAGKSTIIEALRILFDEESRQKKISANKEQQQQWREEHLARCRDVLRGLGELRRQYVPQPQWSEKKADECREMLNRLEAMRPVYESKARSLKWKLVATFVAGLVFGLMLVLA